MTLLFVNASQVVTCAGAPRARVGTEMRDCGILLDAAVAVVGERIAAIGSRDVLVREHASATVVDCAGGVLTPGLVDSHTHAIFGKPRYEEQERRAAGADYMEIAKQGGGIHASVRDVRTRDAADILALARPRLARLASYGTTTVEVKSGYGLSIEDELKILRVISELASDLPMRIVPTWLGAHEIPREARATPATRASYVKMLRHDMLPLVVAERLAVFADVFCEPGVFTIDETRDLLLAA
ncbi:MAG: imidazolonepropionase, partial [Gemmatimonadaceae bacterium]